MYADIEEARSRGQPVPPRPISSSSRRGRRDTPDSPRSRSRSPRSSRSRSRSPTRSRSPETRKRMSSETQRREDELQAQLRRRRLGDARDAKRRDSRSPSPRRSREGSMRSHSPAHSRSSRRESIRDDDRGRRRPIDYDGYADRRSSQPRDPYARDDYRRGYPRGDPYGAPPPPPSRGYYDRRDPYAGRRDPYRDDRRRSRDLRSSSPRRGGPPARRPPTPDPEDYEVRSIFCSQLAARLGQRDLGEFLEEMLGEGSVRDVRVVSDRITGRSKGIGYVELAHEDLVPKAIDLTGHKLFGIPIVIQRTEAARNRGEGASTAEAPIRPNQPAPLPQLDPELVKKLPLPPGFIGADGTPVHLAALAAQNQNIRSPAVIHANTAARLYVGSLNFNLTADDIKSIFAPFGEVLYVDLHCEPGTTQSKGFCFVQFKRAEDAEKAIQNMNGFELAGRQLRVNHVNAHSSGNGGRGGSAAPADESGATATRTSAYDEGGGAGLTQSSRAALMEKLARIDTPAAAAPQAPVQQVRPASIPQALSKALLLANMFDPAEETERDWDLDLADEVKEEAESKYGKVEQMFVDKDSAGEIWIRFAEQDASSRAREGLNGRFFGGRSITAQFVAESIMRAKLS